jgi:hypothetical protein
MQRLVIFRSSPTVFAPLVAAARAGKHPIVDVFDAGAITRLVSDSNGEASIEIYGSHLQKDDRVLALGTPSPSGASQMSDGDRNYAFEEWRVALLAALGAFPRTAAPIADYLLAEKVAQIQKLADLGWPVPNVRYVYRENEAAYSERYPLPDDQTKTFLVITPLRVLVHPEAAFAWEMAGWLSSAVARTQQYLRESMWPWAVVPVAVTSRGAMAFGLSWYLPATLTDVDLSNLLADAWQVLGEK